MSNNKQSMKLYTREQMIEAIIYGQKLEGFDWISDMIDSLDAIELPSDEEILTKSKEEPDNSDIETAARIGYVAGAKWMRDKIQGGKL